MIEFKYIEILSLLILILPLIFFIKKRKNNIDNLFSTEVLKKITINKGGITKQTRDILMILSICFAIVALSRPYIAGKHIKVDTKFIDVVVGFDVSNSMFANDIYPDRFSFAKLKFKQLLDNFQNGQIGIIGFSSRAFLISPMTHDYNSLKFLTLNLSFDYINLKGTSILNALKSVNMLYEDKDQSKIAIFFTDGGDKDDLSKEILYAKEHKISVFIYAIATIKGGVIKTANGVLKDKKGDLIITRLNTNIKQLALQTGGAYLKYSLKKGDISQLTDIIKAKYNQNKTKQDEIVDNKELFFIPLLLSLILFFISIFSLPRKTKGSL